VFDTSSKESMTNKFTRIMSNVDFCVVFEPPYFIPAVFLVGQVYTEHVVGP
jgi:hypothetical protein